MKLSIIIPVYNAEKHLVKCLESIICQEIDKKDFEVILINDGSTDGSLEIAESFWRKIVNYTILSRGNQGEAASRNTALNIAKGEYITFLDSDDYYQGNALSMALKIITSDDLDILYLRMKQVDEQGDFLGFVFDMPNKGVAARGLNYTRRPFPATVYRREIIREITFPLGILIGPDSVFNAKVQSLAQRVSFTQKAIYNYTYRKDSLSKLGKSEQAFRGFLKAINEVHRFQKHNFKDNPDAKVYFDKVYAIFVTRILELSIMPGWNRPRYNQLVLLLKEEDLSSILGNFEVKYPYVSSSYFRFRNYQKFLALKSHVYKLLYRA